MVFRTLSDEDVFSSGDDDHGLKDVDVHVLVLDFTGILYVFRRNDFF